MSDDTNSYEVDPRDYRDLGYRMDNRYSIRPKKTDWVMTSLLALLNLLMAAGVVGVIGMYGKVTAFEVRFDDLNKKVDMIVEGRIRIPDGR
jgi:hypothetical protein